MFYFEKKDDLYYIWADKIKGKFGPFSGIYVKNKNIGNTPLITKELILDYPGYKFSIGVGEKNIFVIGLDGIENIFNIS